MFGRSKPVVFDPYRRRRSPFRPPAWLVLLLSGVVVGAGGVIVAQQRYLPPRLSASASAELRSAYDRADAERLRLQAALAATEKRLAATLAEKSALNDDLALSRATVDQLRGDLTSVVASLPPDPRTGVVEVRAGRFSSEGGRLIYDVVLTRERNAGKPMPGVMQLLVAGETERGAESTVSLKPVTLSVSGHEVLRGSLPLPAGFRPRQTTIQVLDRGAGKLLGMRVLPVK